MQSIIGKVLTLVIALSYRNRKYGFRDIFDIENSTTGLGQF